MAAPDSCDHQYHLYKLVCLGCFWRAKMVFGSCHALDTLFYPGRCDNHCLQKRKNRRIDLCVPGGRFSDIVTSKIDDCFTATDFHWTPFYDGRLPFREEKKPINWSGGPDLNRRPSPWQGDILPLNYHRNRTVKVYHKIWYDRAMYGVRFVKHCIAIFTNNPLSLTLWTRLHILASYLIMKVKEVFLVKLFHVALQSERLAYPPLTMHFYAYTQFVSLFEDIFIDHLYYHPVLRKRGVRIAVGGAHMGMFSAYCHWINTTAHVTAFEADPVTFSLLETNVHRNGWTQTKCVNAALAGKKGSAWFYFDPVFPGSFVSSLIQERGLGGKKRVSTVKLSSYYHKKPFDFVKLDIEGAEYDVLRDLVKSRMLHKTDVYVVEFHHNIRGRTEQLTTALQLFVHNGFTYIIAAEKPSAQNEYQDIFVSADRVKQNLPD